MSKHFCACDLNNNSYTNLFSPNDHENGKIILKYCHYLKRSKNYIALFARSIENLTNLKYHTS